MELRERLAGNRAAAANEEFDAFAELKDRIHMSVISELGPQLYNAGVDDAALHRLVVGDIRQRLTQERGISLADRDRLVQEIADDTLGHGPIESLLQDDTRDRGHGQRAGRCMARARRPLAADQRPLCR